ncbi:MAG: lpg2359 family Dot/Icm T4SS effector [Gammaproteobacteria bacterium]
MTDSATLIDRLQNDLKTAMREKAKPLLATLRLIMAAIKQVEVDERISVDDQRLLAILDKMAKQRLESIEQYQQAKRDDLVAKEAFELDVIRSYLPEPLNENELTSIINEAVSAVNANSMADMGKVMAMIKPQIQGRADIAAVSQHVKQILS